MLEQVTICTALWNTAKSVALMHESFRLHHGIRPQWNVCDDGSTDGADLYAQEKATTFMRSVVPRRKFGLCFDDACKSATTKYVLTVDSDVEFLSPMVGDMIALAESEGAFCVAPEYQPQGTSIHLGVEMQGQRRIDHCCTLFRTDHLHHLLNWISFSVYIDPCHKAYFDGGAMLWRASQLLGLKVAEPKFIRERMVHWGGLSAMWTDGEDVTVQARRKAIYETIGKRLDRLRAGAQDREGIVWTDALYGWKAAE